MTLLLVTAWNLLVGLFAGLAAGLLGVGGGVIVVPALLISFGWLGVDVGVRTQLAVGTSLSSIALTSISSIIGHQRRQAVVWPAAIRLGSGMVIGGVLGANIALATPGPWLQASFAVLAVSVAIRMLRTASSRAENETHVPTNLPAWLALAGVGIGAVSSFFGIGGGTLTVPTLSALRFSIRHAVATSAACGFPIAVAGSLTFALRQQVPQGLAHDTLGLVHVPACLTIAAASVCSAQLGARWAHSLPRARLRRIFGGLLLVVGLQMLLNGLL